MNSSEIINKYIEVTNNIIIMIKDGDDIELQMGRRQELLEQLVGLNLTKNELKKLIETSGMREADIRLKNVLQSSMADIKSEIFKIKNQQKANNGYNMTSNMTQGFNRMI